MGRVGFYRNGDWNAICDQCGQPYKASGLNRDGQTRGALMVCPRCYDPLHPQELMRPVADPKPIPWARPESPDIFVQNGSGDANRIIDGAATDSTSMG
jgi:hypothetical protein